MRIGIFGGSFNPVHRGHLRLAQAALDELNLGRVIFVPAFRNPLKRGAPLLPWALRVRMLRAALKGRRRFQFSLFEIKRKGLSYTVDTLRYFRRRFCAPHTLYFLTGADTARQLGRWKSLEEIFRLCRFVVLSRPGYALRSAPKRAILVRFDAADVSSTTVRRRKRGILKELEPSNPTKR